MDSIRINKLKSYLNKYSNELTNLGRNKLRRRDDFHRRNSVVKFRDGRCLPFSVPESKGTFEQRFFPKDLKEDGFEATECSQRA